MSSRPQLPPPRPSPRLAAGPRSRRLAILWRAAARLAVLALMGATWPAGASVRALPGGEATVAVVGAVHTRDPAKATTAPERLLAAATQCTVTSLLDGPPEVSADGRSVTLHLKAGRVFHDGSAIGAEDVARSLARLADPATGAVAAWRLLAIDGVADRLAGQPAIPAIRASDPLTVQVDLAVPGIDLAARLDDPRLPVVGADGHTGCGPFVELRPVPAGSRGMVLVPFDRAPGGRGYLDRLTVVPLSPGADTTGFDAVIGGPRGTPTGPATRATLLVAFGRGNARRAAALDDRVARAVDPAALVRDFVGGTATAMSGRTAPGGQPASVPGGPVDLAYDPADPSAAAVAGRIQVRLHDQGLEVTLSPVAGLDPAAARRHDLALVTLPAVPVRTPDTLMAVATALGQPELALQVLAAQAVSPGATPTPTTTPSLDAAAVARDFASLHVLPLYRRARRLQVSPRLLGASPGRATAVAPASLWRWPLPGDPPPALVAPDGTG